MGEHPGDMSGAGFLGPKEFFYFPRQLSNKPSRSSFLQKLELHGCGSILNHQESDGRFLSMFRFARESHFRGCPVLTRSHIPTTSGSKGNDSSQPPL